MNAIQLNHSYEYANGIITPLAVLAELPSGNRIFDVEINRSSGVSTRKELHEVHMRALIERYKKRKI